MVHHETIKHAIQSSQKVKLSMTVLCWIRNTELCGSRYKMCI